jgi:Lar family restriction alleviation protein
MTQDTTRAALLPCPFCGHDTPELERMGTPRQSCIVICGNCGCRHESSDEGERCGQSWNKRAALAQPQQAAPSPMAELEALRDMLKAEVDRLIAGKAAPQQAAPAVATVTECEACFTPDVCQLRGTCDHYAAERLRVAAPAGQAAAPSDPGARSVFQAPKVLNGNDKAYWVLGWNECREAFLKLEQSPRAAGARTHPYRNCTNHRAMNWQTTYPTLATVMEAGFETVCTWCEKLPAPQTDVERTVMRRLHARRDVLAGEQLRAVRPDIADKLNELVDRLERLGVKSPVKRI